MGERALHLPWTNSWSCMVSIYPWFLLFKHWCHPFLEKHQSLGSLLHRLLIPLVANHSCCSHPWHSILCWINKGYVIGSDPKIPWVILFQWLGNYNPDQNCGWLLLAHSNTTYIWQVKNSPQLSWNKFLSGNQYLIFIDDDHVTVSPINNHGDYLSNWGLYDITPVLAISHENLSHDKKMSLYS